MRYRIAVLSDTGDWVRFDAGYCDTPQLAEAQKVVYQTRYPERLFVVLQSDK